ncbi:hypothetical protein MGU_07117 [Metarhizium guizhouense ARSEF 977]|uniref:Ecp2 effector protein domain-containing protein n=1 Tax=Metarhizium guizhouense (strain ARSEF 977) TaxID=1276136 RepID=A0A0B4I0P5_METGA|nr:hypothetical protein MGU_07117 [Metarhizium guizhouense ARSEF 977]
MQFWALLTAVMATVVSAFPLEAAEDTGVTFYEHVNFAGYHYTIPSINRCWPMPQTISQKVSSVRFSRSGVSCAVFRNRSCLPPVLYAGIRETIRDLHLIGIGDEVGSVFCSGINRDDALNEEWLDGWL